MHRANLTWATKRTCSRKPKLAAGNQNLQPESGVQTANTLEFGCAFGSRRLYPLFTRSGFAGERGALKASGKHIGPTYGRHGIYGAGPYIEAVLLPGLPWAFY